MTEGIPAVEQKVAARQAKRAYSKARKSQPRTLDLVNVDDITEKEVEWEWQSRIPRGMVTILAGDPGDGKSYFSMALACAVSSGDRLPGDDRPPARPANIIIANFEDTPEQVIKKRIRLIGKGVGTIRLINGVYGEDGHRHPFRASDLALLETALDADRRVKLVVIDPAGDYVGGKVNTSSDNEVRDVLVPLVELSRRKGIAIVVVMHLRKAEAERILYRLAGSAGGFSGVARSVLLAGKEPDSGRRAIVHLKCNVDPLVDPVEFWIDDDGFHWKGVAADLTAEMLVAAPDRQGQKLRAAEKWLTEQLDGHVVRQSEIKKAAAGLHSWGTLRRAFENIGADSDQPRVGGHAGKSVWFLDRGLYVKSLALPEDGDA